ncbi:MAG: rane fusion protein multidrug efflux system [Chthoniobacter sp.]|jgi:multidrug efflux system membrane fusion protein|nr:rane fusion protein multidrug efflux system [Chthoniobacter sp.]
MSENLIRNEERLKGAAVAAFANAEPRESHRVRNFIIALLVLVVLGLAGVRIFNNRQASAASGNPAGPLPVPVTAGTVAQKDVPIYLDGLGTIQALNTVTIRARIDGELKRVAFVEGQDVKAGDLLAQIDDAVPRAQLAQAEAKAAQDQAQLENARLDQVRNEDLIAKKAISPQQFDTQRALVKQLEATVKADQAAVENAQVQLGYATIVSPLDGRTGLRLMDQGNMVHANDVNGLVVVAQLQPISLVFTLPEQTLVEIHKREAESGELSVLAVDRDNKTVLDTGKLAVIDNQIDTSTGTIRLKATFPNQSFQLWPGQFANARLLLTVRKAGVVIPASVVQRGPQGSYAFVIKDDETAEIRPLKVAQIEQGEALIDEGLQAGERVVVDGQYKLQPGSKVKLSDAPAKPGGPNGPRNPIGGAKPH